MKRHWTDILSRYGACVNAIERLRRYKSRTEAWRETPNENDLLWWLRNVERRPLPPFKKYTCTVGPVSACPGCASRRYAILRLYPTPPRPRSVPRAPRG